MALTQRILHGGTIGTQRVRVWLEPRAGGIGLFSHDIGMTAALRAEWPCAGPKSAIDLLAEKYKGNAAATSAFRGWRSSAAFRIGS